MTKPKKKESFDWKLLVRVFSLARPYKEKFFTAVFLTVSIAILGPLRPYLIQVTIDKYIAVGDGKGLLNMAGLLLSLLILGAAMQWWGTLLSNFLGQQIIYDLRNKVYKHLLSFKQSYFDKTPVGNLVTRSISDIEVISEVFSEGMINIVGDILQIAVLLVLMFSTDVKLSLVCLSVLPLLFYSGYLFKEAVKSSFEEVRNKVSQINTFVQEHLTGMQIVQIFNREEQEFKKFKALNAEHRNANIQSVFYYSVFFPVVEVLSAVAIGLVVWYGSSGVINGEFSTGVLIAFIMYLNLFFRPIRQLADRFNNLQMGMVASERIFKLLDDNQPIESEGNLSAIEIQGNIAFEKVNFSYNEGQPVLKDISFTLEKGKTLALVGATGAGKSSIINLLSRFYDISSGKITIDGISVQTYTLESLRSKIAVVLQDVFLFSGTIMDNIKLYNSEISDEKVIETAKLLGAHNFISLLPKGYMQPVMERGATLSVGQRQLISFVRAMVHNPAILVLDEATSSIDHETEEIIQNAIEKMRQGRSSIMIAHRLSTISHADEIIVLDKGEIVERGKHTHLLQNSKFYKELYEHQFASTIS